MRWPLGYVALDSVVEGWEDAVVIKFLRNLGFEAVDWSFVQLDRLNGSPSAFRELVERSREAGLDVPQLVMADDFVTLDSALWQRKVDHTLRAVDAAAEAGVGTIGVSTGPHGWNAAALNVGVDVEASEAWDTAVRAIARIVEHAEGTGVRVGLESVWGTLTDNGQDTQRILDTVPGLGITLDPSHFTLTGDDIPALARQWHDRIVHVHLKDGFGRRGTFQEDFFFPILGEGQVPWRPLFEALDEIGYAGSASIEAESYTLLHDAFGGDPTGPARLSLELANRLYDSAGL